MKAQIANVEKRDKEFIAEMVKKEMKGGSSQEQAQHTEVPRECQIIVSGWIEEADGDKIVAEIEKVLAIGTRRRRVVKVETWEDPATFGVITFDNPLAKFGFFKKMKNEDIKTSQNKTMVFRSNEPYEVRLHNKFLGQVKCKLHESKQIALERIKIDRRNKQVTLDTQRVAYVDVTGNFKYEGIGLEVKTSVDSFMEDWQSKRNQ